MPVLLDTNAISALFEGNAGLARLLDGCERLSLPIVAVGEYRYGLARSRHRPQLETLIGESQLLVVDGETSRAYASVRSQLKAAGTPIPENDVWIAALARQHSLPLVSRDRHFDRVPELERRFWE